jgi:acyl-CoA synthetase (AMP-forming)/AMP-acid ligase II
VKERVVLLNRSKNPLEGISPEYSDYLKNWLYEILYNDALICQNPILPQTISYQEIIHGDYSVYKQALANRESEVDADDALIILHTSGTAGQPQGSLPIHHNVISMSLVQKDEFHLADDMQAGEYDFDLVSGESFHSAATQYGAVLTIAVWALVLKGFVDADRGIELLGKYLKDYLDDYKISREYIFRYLLPMTSPAKPGKNKVHQKVDKGFYD